MGMKRKLQQKMRQTFYTPKNGKLSVLNTMKSLDTVEEILSEGVGKVIKGGKKKVKATETDDDKSESDGKEKENEQT